MLEDRAIDAELILHELRRAGYDPVWQRVASESEYLEALDIAELDVILADFNLPGFGAPRALELLKTRNLDVPFIVVSGTIGEETAVQVLKNGAADYLLKDRLARLGKAVQRAIDERQLMRAKREAELAQREAEERMRFALEASHVGIWEVDLTTGAARWSETLEALHGMPPGDRVGTIESILEYVHPDDRAQAAQAIERATREHQDSNVMYRTRWPDGSLHWVSCIGRTVFDEAGVPQRAAGISLDVTDRVLMEERLREQAALAKLGEMAAVIAHEVRNPLAAVRGAIQVLRGRFVAGTKEAGVMAEIVARIDGLNDLVKSMLLFARPPNPRPTAVDVAQLIGTTAEFAKGDPIFRNVQVSVVGSSPPIAADAELLKIVLSNLFINSADAMGGQGAISVAVESVADSCRIAVTDQGPGIPPDLRDKIFAPFFTTKARGTGLGLPIAKRLIEAHHGSVSIDCPPGGGTKVILSLPLPAVPSRRRPGRAASSG
jgi:two-component system, cell cycle sensor histidine kinase and response regulator CckA